MNGDVANVPTARAKSSFSVVTVRWFPTAPGNSRQGFREYFLLFESFLVHFEIVLRKLGKYWGDLGENFT